MIRVTVELVPFGQNKWAKTIAGMEIINEGKSSFKVSGNEYDYNVVLHLDGTFEKTLFGKVENHDRDQDVWVLITDAILAAYKEGNRLHKEQSNLKAKKDQ